MRFKWVKYLMFAALGLSGCASMHYSTIGKMDGIKVKGANGPVSQLVRADVSGFYLFWTAPLCCGDTSWNDRKGDMNGGTVFFVDHVDHESVQAALNKAAKARNASLVDLSFSGADQSFAGVSYQGAVGWCFGKSNFAATSVLCPNNTKTTVKK